MTVHCLGVRQTTDAMERIVPEMPVAAKGPVIHLPVKPGNLAADFTATGDLHVLAHGDVLGRRRRGMADGDLRAGRAADDGFRSTTCWRSRSASGSRSTSAQAIRSTRPCRRGKSPMSCGAAWTCATCWPKPASCLRRRCCVGVGLDGGDFVGRPFVHYLKDIPLERVREGDVLVAHRLNGEPLTGSNGCPARLVVPGL